MKIVPTTLGAMLTLFACIQASAQNQSDVVFTDEVETVVTVRGVHYVNRTVTVEDPNGERITIKVPDEAQNLYQVQPGNKFKVRYAQAVAVGLLEPGQEPGAGIGEAMKLAPKGATPGGVLVRVAQISGKIVDIDYALRTILVRGPQGNLREFVVSERVKGFGNLMVGDVVGLKVTEALAMEMIPE